MKIISESGEPLTLSMCGKKVWLEWELESRDHAAIFYSDLSDALRSGEFILKMKTGGVMTQSPPPPPLWNPK
jgi:hypothetical protein